MGKKVVILGGGTGPLCTLQLSEYDYDISVISSVTDDGGSTGDLLEENPSILPPGDIRRIISYSSENPLFGKKLEERVEYSHPIESSDLISLLGYYGDEVYVSELVRIFIKNDNEKALKQELGIKDIKGHTLGNLILAALMLGYGNSEGVERLSKMAETTVDVVPASEENAIFVL